MNNKRRQFKYQTVVHRTFLHGFPFLICFHFSYSQRTVQKFEPVSFSKVNITDQFWKPKIDKVATATLKACVYQTEVNTPRIRNFEKVVRHQGEKHEGIYYDDSDVYKALEAMGYSLKNHPDSGLERTADRWIDIISAAQMPDGYLNTYFQLGDIQKRWTNIEAHEDYNAGHLIEAAIAYYNATGKRKLLDVAIQLADHIDSFFRVQNRKWFSGHEEIELALMKLYHLTKNERYLKLADWYLAQRGHRYYPYGKSWFTPDYWQDLVPVKEQKEITGHPVRAMYLYSGAADVAAVTGDEGYVHAMKNIWEDVVYRNMYITGGIGSAGDNEGFSKDYDLPNEQAYCETCASVGMVFWNQRMSQLTGDAKFIDVLEKSLYNGALDGISLSGDRFFYDNPLASLGNNQRREWFGTACCPANIARLIASLGNYIYGRSDKGIWVNLFVGSNTTIPVGKNIVDLTMETNYPWSGDVKLVLNPKLKTTFALYIRTPGWLKAQSSDQDLYRFENSSDSLFSIKINGKPATFKQDKGYAIIEREWKKNDAVELSLPMIVKRVISNDSVKQNNDRVALQRGPLVYCVEGADNHGQAWNILLPDQTSFKEIEYFVLNEKVIALQVEATVVTATDNGNSIQTKKTIITAIPYYTWANRGQNQMQVWLPRKIKDIKLNY